MSATSSNACCSTSRERKIQHGLSFSDAGMREIEDLHQRLVVNLRLAVAVFLNGDLKSAQQLIAEKVTFRELEMQYADSHLQRLSDRTPQSMETSSLHLDLLSRLQAHQLAVLFGRLPDPRIGGRAVQDPRARGAAGPRARARRRRRAAGLAERQLILLPLSKHHGADTV